LIWVNQPGMPTSREHCRQGFVAEPFASSIGVLSLELRIPPSRGRSRERAYSKSRSIWSGSAGAGGHPKMIGVKSKRPRRRATNTVLIRMAQQVGSGTPLRGLIWIFECSCRAYPIRIERTFGERHVYTHSNHLCGREDAGSALQRGQSKRREHFRSDGIDGRPHLVRPRRGDLRRRRARRVPL
jgi:hypothetical protein